MTRDEAPNRKLSTLAQLFGATTTPDHRALHDARATVDVLHALLARVGNLGVVTLEELTTYTSRVSSAQRRKRYLADGLPSAPGVYLFKDRQGRVLYVGTSRDIRRRVRSYFTASEQRTRMAEMVGIAESVTPVVCHTTLEAEVRELRLIAEHKPRYNRRSRHPERALWVKLTVEAFPRLCIVREVRDDGTRYVGPFSSRMSAESAIAALHEVVPLRQCTKKLSTRGRSSDCALADMGRCGAPCTGAQTVDDYAAVVAEAAAVLGGDSRDVVSALHARMSLLAAAGALRGRRRPCATGCCTSSAAPRAPSGSRRSRPPPRSSPPGARADGGWELVCVRFGRLAGTTTTPRGADPMPFVRALTRQRRGRGRPAAGRRRPRRPRRPRRSCAGSRLRGCGSSPSRESGPARCTVPARPAPASSPWPPRRATRWGSTSRGRRPSRAPASTSARDGVRPPWR